MMGNLGQHRNIQNLQARIAERFAKQQSGFGSYRLSESVRVPGVDKGGF